MALLFMDGFDHYEAADIESKWTSKQYNPDIDTTGGRFGTGCMTGGSSNANARKAFASTHVSFVAGVAYMQSGNYTSSAIRLMDGTTCQLEVKFDISNAIYVMRNGTWLATASMTYQTNTWYYIELKGTINNSTGSYELRINGVTRASGSGADTQDTGNAYINGVELRNSPNSVLSRWDDLYVCDLTGSYCNDFLGDVRIETLIPSGAGTYSQWTPSTGSNYENVDDSPAIDDDTTYNASDATGEKDVYALGDLATTAGTIYAIQTNLCARKDDAGTAKIKKLHYINSSDYLDSDEHSLGDSYNFYLDVDEQNPDTTSAWTISDVNALQTGAQRTV